MIFNTYVPGSGPLGARTLFIGESPGADEERLGQPFVGESGQILTNVLGRAGKTRDEVRLMNLSNYRPAGNKFELLLGSHQLQEGIKELLDYLKVYPPNVIAPLGARALEFFTGKKGIHAWRGSILPCITPGSEHVKVIPTFHPSAVLRDRTLYPIFDQDIQRIITDSEFPEPKLPERSYVINPTGLDRELWAQRLCNEEWLAVDIESVMGSTHILCIGFSPTPDLGVCFVNDGSSHYAECVQRILSSQAKKCFHFGTFDTAVLRQNGFTVDNYAWDTMVAQHVMWLELPRSLDYLTSIYTREPYYKSSGRGEIPSDLKSWGSKVVKENLWIYNAKDCCVTREIQLQQEKEMSAAEKPIFEFEMAEVVELASHVSDAGMLIDQERREIFRRALVTKWNKLQVLLDALCSAVDARYKGTSVNAKSTPQMRKLLYETLGLPEKRKRAKDGKPGALTADEDAIVQLIGHCADKIASYKTEEKKREWRLKLGILRVTIEIRGVRQLLSNYINISISTDGRIRSTYKIPSTETARWAAESYIDGTGNNAQTWPREALEIPEELLDPTKTWTDLPLFTLGDDAEVEDKEYASSSAG